MKEPLLRHWLAEAPYTLALSSSFFGFYAHCGVAAALYEAKLRPARLAGSSAGALVAAALAAGISPERMAEICFALEKSDFWDPYPGLGYLRGKRFRTLLAKHLPADFAELSTPLAVAVFDILRARTAYLESGPLVPAVVASCAVPLLFQPVRIGRRLYLDGGILDKPGFRAPGNERVLCAFLESRGRTGVYERKTAVSRFGGNHKALAFRQLPAVKPHELSTGYIAFDAAYSRTRGALNQPARNAWIEA